MIHNCLVLSKYTFTSTRNETNVFTSICANELLSLKAFKAYEHHQTPSFSFAQTKGVTSRLPKNMFKCNKHKWHYSLMLTVGAFGTSNTSTLRTNGFEVRFSITSLIWHTPLMTWWSQSGVLNMKEDQVLRSTALMCVLCVRAQCCSAQRTCCSRGRRSTVLLKSSCAVRICSSSAARRRRRKRSTRNTSHPTAPSLCTTYQVWQTLTAATNLHHMRLNHSYCVCRQLR